MRFCKSGYNTNTCLCLVLAGRALFKGIKDPWLFLIYNKMWPNRFRLRRIRFDSDSCLLSTKNMQNLDKLQYKSAHTHGAQLHRPTFKVTWEASPKECDISWKERITTWTNWRNKHYVQLYYVKQIWEI